MNKQAQVLGETPHETQDEPLEEQWERTGYRHDGCSSACRRSRSRGSGGTHLDETTAPLAPPSRIVEGSLIESILLLEAAADEDTETLEATTDALHLAGQSPRRTCLLRFQGTLSHLTLVQEQPKMLGEQLFSTTKVNLLLPLLEQYPHYCPYEVLWASFHGSTSEIAIVRARNRLQRAREEGYWDEEMRPLRIMLSRARLKLQEMGPDIVSLFETGYLPTRHDRRRLRRKTDETGGERDAPR